MVLSGQICQDLELLSVSKDKIVHELTLSQHVLVCVRVGQCVCIGGAPDCDV
jgi:hypothetical protein